MKDEGAPGNLEFREAGMTRRGSDRQRILVVDDEENLRHMLKVLLGKQGYQVEQAADGARALEMTTHDAFDYILCDIRMPVMEGPEFLRQAVARGVGGTIIMMSAYGTVDTAVECMKLGAYDYISKPFKQDEIVMVLKKAEERERLKRENRRLREEIGREWGLEGIVSRDARMREIFSLVRKVCDYKTTVLILGESGTGKELIARAIHCTGNRSGAPFVAVNCGAIPDALLESELFGHEKGAFTDAAHDKAGLFEQADGGTLFLDEIGEMPLQLQVKLLRVLQEGEIRRIGGATAKKVDVRMLSATSRDLEKDVAEGRFREDLYFRLNVFAIMLPPLRERPDDIPLLAAHFLDKHGGRLGRAGVTCTPAALKALMAHQWPGNVRELENVIERALILCDSDSIDIPCLPASVRGKALSLPQVMLDSDSLSIKRAEEAIERDLVRRALERTGGNRTHAAKLLEISLRALLYKIKEFGLE
jgi:two-component system, NtrC family, response regulator AtoC